MQPLDIVMKHDRYRANVLNMQASENYLSSSVRRALASDMASRYSMVFDSEVHGVFVHNVYGGTKYEEEIVELAEKLAMKVFGLSHSNVKPLSGHLAAMTVLIALAKRGSKIMAIPPEKGGYDGYYQPYLPDILGLEYIAPELNDGILDPNHILKTRPDIIILGASYILFPYDLKPILDAAAEIDAMVVYDASHVLGLLPSGFQNDIEKCAVVYGSTHKSFPGPQGGIILTNQSELADKIDKNLTWRTQDNFHVNRVAALAQALWEFEPVAVEYGKRVSENSYALAKTLDEIGLKIKYPPHYTRSHQVIVDEHHLLEKFNITPPKMSNILEKNGIVIDAVGRIGTAELTWKGYTAEDMEHIAHIIVSALKGNDVKAQVKNLVKKWDGKTLGEKFREGI